MPSLHCDDCAEVADHYRQKERKAVALLRRAREALPDPELLEALAVWLDVYDDERGIIPEDQKNREVQRSLIEWSRQSRGAAVAIDAHLEGRREDAKQEQTD